MADDGAVRTRRWKLHKAGDHSLCRRCPAVKAALPPSFAPLAGIPADSAPGALDPAAELQALAARLIAAHQADPGNAIVARELRMTLQALDRKADDGLGELYAALSEA